MIYIKTTMGLFVTSWIGVPPSSGETPRATTTILHRAGWAQTRETHEKIEQTTQTHGVCSPKIGISHVPLSGWASTHAIKRLVPEKSPESGEMPHLSRSASAQRSRLKSCQTECDLQSATLMVKGRGVNYLAFPFYWGWMRVGRRGPAAAPSPAAPHSLHNPGWMPWKRGSIHRGPACKRDAH